MQRRYLLAGGAALGLLLVAIGVVALVLLAANNGSGSQPSRPNDGQSIKAEPGDTVITLTWGVMQGAAGYSIYRNGSSVPLNPTPLTGTEYEDIGLSNGRTYTYTVAPVDSTGKPGQALPVVQAKPGSRSR